MLIMAGPEETRRCPYIPASNSVTGGRVIERRRTRQGRKWCEQKTNEGKTRAHTIYLTYYLEKQCKKKVNKWLLLSLSRPLLLSLPYPIIWGEGPLIFSLSSIIMIKNWTCTQETLWDESSPFMLHKIYETDAAGSTWWQHRREETRDRASSDPHFDVCMCYCLLNVYGGLRRDNFNLIKILIFWLTTHWLTVLKVERGLFKNRG